MNLPLGAFIGHMSGADFFGLVVSVLVCLYLAGLPQLVGIFVCRDSRFACKSRGEVAARGEIL